MKLIDRIKKFLGFKSKAGRPRISQSKQDAIKSAPVDVTDSDLARLPSARSKLNCFAAGSKLLPHLMSIA